MKILAIDPGSGTTGWAVTDAKGTLLTHGQFKSLPLLSNVRPYDADTRLFMVNFTGLQKPDLIIVEDFVGSGRRDSHITNTIKLLGYYLALAHTSNIPTRMQVPQARRPFVEQAKKKIKGYDNRHAADALAHCFKYLHDEEAKSRAKA